MRERNSHCCHAHCFRFLEAVYLLLGSLYQDRLLVPSRLAALCTKPDPKQVLASSGKRCCAPRRQRLYCRNGKRLLCDPFPEWVEGRTKHSSIQRSSSGLAACWNRLLVFCRRPPKKPAAQAAVDPAQPSGGRTLHRRILFILCR